MKAIVDYLFDKTNRVVVMSGDKYVYFDTQEEVSFGLVDEAHNLQVEEVLLQAETKAIYDKKYLGIDYTNLEDQVYKVSLTNDDANGLIQVKTAFEMGITETNFYFENGTIVPLKSIDDLLHLGQFISIERNKFFL